MSVGLADFDKIHAEFRPKIQRYLTRMVGAADAEDLTQEVMLKVGRSLQNFRGESRLSTWVYRIATNAALDRLRAPAARQTLEPLPDETEAVRDAAPSLEEQLFRQERYECYCAFIQRLPLSYRAVVALAELEELAAGEIADILGLSVDVVKIRLHRGRAKLLRYLRDHCRPEDWL